MKISIDLHGVITDNPKYFETMAKDLIEDGHEVYIMTGAIYGDAVQELQELNFNLKYITEIISVTDYLVNKGCLWTIDKYGRPHFSDNDYWTSKSEIAHDRNFDLHIDDSLIFMINFKTPYAHYKENEIVILPSF